MDNRPKGYQNSYAQNSGYLKNGNQQGHMSRNPQNISRGQQIPNRSNNAQMHRNSNRRSVSKPQKRSFAGRVFKDKNGKLNLLGKIAVGALTIPTIAGIGVTGRNAYDALRFNAFVNSEDYQKIVETIGDNYDNSEYLQVSIPREAYDEYTEKTLKNAVKNEPNMQCFLQEKEFSPEVWAYLLTGEADRSEITEVEILEALNDYFPYADYDRESKDENVLDNNISNFAFMAEYCTSDKNKSNVVNLLDSVIGESSLSNSTEALEYKIKLNDEEIERIQYNTVSELKEKININNNFDRFAQGQDSTLYFKPYVYNFYNSRVGFVQEKMADKSTSQLLKDTLEKYGKYGKMDGISEELRGIPKRFMESKKIANYDEYKNYTNLRNEFYSNVLEEQKNPEESIPKIEADTLELQTRIAYQEVLERFDIPQYIAEVNQLLEEMRETTQKSVEADKEQNRINEKSRELRFDDFDR